MGFEVCGLIIVYPCIGMKLSFLDVIYANPKHTCTHTQFPEGCHTEQYAVHLNVITVYSILQWGSCILQIHVTMSWPSRRLSTRGQQQSSTLQLIHFPLNSVANKKSTLTADDIITPAVQWGINGLPNPRMTTIYTHILFCHHTYFSLNLFSLVCSHEEKN